MKTQMNVSNMIRLAAVAAFAAVALAGCGDDNDNVPKTYQGTFQGQSDQGGVSLTLTGSDASLSIEGKTLKGPVNPIDYDKLLNAQAGFYIYQENDKDKVMDVYWVTPDAASKKEAGGLIYYTTDIVYMQIDLNLKDAAPSVTIVHADQGTVMLDTATKKWEAGWPAHATEVTLVRAAATTAPK